MTNVKHAAPGYPCRCQLDGWMPGIEHIPIVWTKPPWIRERTGKMKALAVVDHIAAGWIRTIDQWAQDPTPESAIITHFAASSTGRRVQYQEVTTPGRHVSGIYNPLSKIVQREGQHAGTTGANGYTIGIEHEGMSVPYPGDPASLRPITWSKSNPWPEPMVMASISIKEWLFENVPTLGKPSRDTIIGHYEVDARNRPDDPASSKDRSVWPVERMIAALSTVTPPQEVEDMDPGFTLIRPGETLSKVAQRTGIPLARIVELNGIPDPNKVSLGQPLRLYDHLWQPPLFGYSQAPSKPDLSVVKAQVGVIKRAVEIADNEIAKVEGK